MSIQPTARTSMDVLINLHLLRARPHHMIATAAVRGVYGDPPVGENRKRCHSSADQFDVDCRLIDARQGAQPVRIMLPLDQSVMEPGENYRTHMKVGMFTRFGRQHFFPEDYMFDPGFGECRAKDRNGLIVVGDFKFEPSPQVGAGKVEVLFDENYDAAFCRTCDDSGLDGCLTIDDFLFTPFAPAMGHFGGCNHDTYVRAPITGVPDDAVIERALLFMHVDDQSGNPIMDVTLLDEDDCPDWSSTSPLSIGLTATKVEDFEVPTTIAGTAYSVNVTELVRAYLARAGRVDGDAIGFKLASIEVENEPSDEYVTHISPTGLTARLIIEYKTPEFTGLHSKPPKLYGYVPFDHETEPQTSGPLPASTGMSPELGAGSIVESRGWDYMADQEETSLYNWVVITPVPNIDLWHDPVYHGDPLYGPSAHSAPFLFNCATTYPIPATCRKRWPRAYNSIAPGMPMFVKPNLRAIVGYAYGQPWSAMESIYFYRCTPDNSITQPVSDNSVRQFRGQTATRRYTWDGDFQKRGWYVEYTGFVISWLVVDNTFTTGMCNPMDIPGDPYACMPRWNAWWQLRVIARWKGDASDEGFKAFILSHEDGFGSCSTPKAQTLCNDALFRCGKQPRSLGDIVWPIAAIQDNCADEYDTGVIPGSTPGGTGRYLPCVTDGKHSRWYLPFNGSNHPATTTETIPMWPETGLYHEFRRTVKLDSAGASTRIDEGWCTLYHMVNQPILRGQEQVPPENTIQKLKIVPATATGGQFFVDTRPLYNDFSNVIAPADAAATVKSALETAASIESGDVTVAKLSDWEWDVEFAGQYEGQRVELMYVYEADFLTGPDAPYTVEVSFVQEPGPE